MLSTVPPCLLFATFSSPTPKGNTLLALSSSSHLSKFLPTYRVYETYHVHCQYSLHDTSNACMNASHISQSLGPLLNAGSTVVPLGLQVHFH